MSFFSCPQQLNRWPCYWLSHWVTDFYFWHYRMALETCDLWDIWSEWWRNMTWPTFWQFLIFFYIFWQVSTIFNNNFWQFSTILTNFDKFWQFWPFLQFFDNFYIFFRPSIVITIIIQSVRSVQLVQLMFLLVRSCFFITLIECLKGHKSLGSPFEGVL